MQRRPRHGFEAAPERSWNSPCLGWAVSLSVGAALIVGDLLEGPRPHWNGVLAAVPFIAAAMLSPLGTAVVGAIVVTAMVVITPWQAEAAGGPGSWAVQTRVLLVAAAAVGGVLIAVHRGRDARRARQLALVAASAQDALMRPIPTELGRLRCATRYRSALEHARIGGDLIEVMRTEYGIRVLVGDIQGKGLPAIRQAGLVLGSFRELAFTTPTLAGLAAALTLSVSRVSRPEEFVTAALLQIDDDGMVQTVLAGHPAPFWLREPGLVTHVEAENDPPLGLLTGEPPHVRVGRLAPGERLVLVTDGILEARRPRRWWMRGRLARERAYFPAAAVIAQELSHPSPEQGLDNVMARVDAWTGHRRDDDRALLVLEWVPDQDPLPEVGEEEPACAVDAR